MPRKKSQTIAPEMESEATDSSDANPTIETATSVLVETQDPPAADNNAPECVYCGIELPEDFKHRACALCHRENQRELILEDMAAKGQTYCFFEEDGSQCTWVVKVRPDGRPVFCPMHHGLRTIFAAKKAIGEMESSGQQVADEVAAKLGEAKDFWADGVFFQALSSAKEVFTLLDKVVVEQRLARIIVSKLSEAGQEVFGEAVNHFEAVRYNLAKASLDRLQKIMDADKKGQADKGYCEQQFAAVNESELSPRAHHAYVDARSFFEAEEFEKAKDALELMHTRQKNEQKLTAQDKQLERQRQRDEREARQRKHNGWRPRYDD